jgi:hypothetical protein
LRYGSIASNTRGSIGVVAWLSKYIGVSRLMPLSTARIDFRLTQSDIVTIAKSWSGINTYFGWIVS